MLADTASAAILAMLARLFVFTNTRTITLNAIVLLSAVWAFLSDVLLHTQNRGWRRDAGIHVKPFYLSSAWLVSLAERDVDIRA